jgi:4-carboxymuconolactone decarboxylase
MRIRPLPPDTLSPDLRQVHDEIASLIGRSQRQVGMMDLQGALTGPFPPMLQYPRYGIPALTFLRSLDNGALDKAVREVAILTVGGAFGARFELYAHEIMAAAYGLTSDVIATLAAGGRPCNLSEPQAIAHDIARALVTGHIVPESTYRQGVLVLGRDAVAELFFLVGGYCLIAVLLNGFDIQAPVGTP